MKNANGAGSVYRVKDGRRKPWKAVVTSGYRTDPDTRERCQCRRIIGYYRTRQEAEDALSDFRRNPYDLDGKRITFSELYDQWSKIHYEKISPSLMRVYKSAYNHAAPLHDLRFTDIRPYHIERCMREADTGSATKNTIKQLCSLMYKYAIKSELVTTNYAAMSDGVSQDAPTIIRLPFSAAEESALWDNLDYPYADMVLIGMYSGWRPQELAILEAGKIDLDERVFYGGLKTKAGKDRAVPIHQKILPLVENRLRTSGGSGRLFTTETGASMGYNHYKTRFDKIKKRFGFQHAPHDVRHTFVTKAKEAGMNEYILKLIVGHSVQDITEKIYTHRQLAELRQEIEKIP